MRMIPSGIVRFSRYRKHTLNIEWDMLPALIHTKHTVDIFIFFEMDYSRAGHFDNIRIGNN